MELVSLLINFITAVEVVKGHDNKVMSRIKEQLRKVTTVEVLSQSKASVIVFPHIFLIGVNKDNHLISYILDKNIY